MHHTDSILFFIVVRQWSHSHVSSAIFCCEISDRTVLLRIHQSAIISTASEIHWLPHYSAGLLKDIQIEDAPYLLKLDGWQHFGSWKWKRWSDDKTNTLCNIARRYWLMWIAQLAWCNLLTTPQWEASFSSMWTSKTIKTFKKTSTSGFAALLKETT